MLPIYSKGEGFVFTESQVSIMVTPCRREICECVVNKINGTNSPQVSLFVCPIFYYVLHYTDPTNAAIYIDALMSASECAVLSVCWSSSS